MSVSTAQARVMAILAEADIVSIDDKNTIMPEGNLLVLEGIALTKVQATYTFGLYVAKKVLNKNTASIYGALEYIVKQMVQAELDSIGDDSAGIRSVLPNGFENGILEYRCEVYVTESKMKG